MADGVEDDWRSGELPALGDATFGWERSWFAGVVQPVLAAAEDSAAAARMILEHQTYVAEDPDPRLATLYRRLEDSALAAERNALLARAAYEEMLAGDHHGQVANQIAELAARSFDATLHLASVIGLLPRNPPDDPGQLATPINV